MCSSACTMKSLAKPQRSWAWAARAPSRAIPEQAIVSRSQRNAEPKLRQIFSREERTVAQRMAGLLISRRRLRAAGPLAHRGEYFSLDAIFRKLNLSVR